MQAVSSRGMVASTLLVLAVACAGVAIAATAAQKSARHTVDYAAYWAHVGDEASSAYLYDCSGYLDVVVKGNIAYATTSWPSGLQVVDISDPLSPVNRGHVGLGETHGCDVRDHYVYVAVGASSVVVVDVDDHDQPVLGTLVSTGAQVNDLVVSGAWLYALLASDVLQVYSLQQSWNPQLVAELTLPGQYDQRLTVPAGAAGGGGVVLAAGVAGLVAVDVSLPEWPAVAGTLALPLTANGILGLHARDGLAVCATYNETHLVDATDPADLQLVGTLEDESGIGAMITSDGRLWLGRDGCWSTNGLRIFDVSDPAAPVLVGEDIRGLRGFPSAMVESQGLVVVAEYFCWCAGEWPGLHVYRMGDLPLPDPLAVEAEQAVRDLVAHGDLVHAVRFASVQTWDLADPAAPQLLQEIAGADGYWRLAADGDVLATIGYQASLQSYWLQLLSRGPTGELTLRGQLPLATYPTDIDLSGDRAFLGYGLGSPGGIEVVDIGDLDAPESVTVMRPGLQVTDLAVHGDIMALCFAGNALRIFDISDLADPVRIALLDQPPYDYEELEFEVRDGRLLLLAGRSQFFEVGGSGEVWDLTDPAGPVLLAAAPTLPGTETYGVALGAGGTLAVASTRNLTIARWDEPAGEATFLGRVPINQPLDTIYATQVALTDQAIVVGIHGGSGDGYFGQGQLQVWPLPAGTVTGVEDPADPGAGDGSGDGDGAPAALRPRLAAHPNPFNPSTTLSFTLPAEAAVTLDIVDLRGRRVRQLVRGSFAAGEHTVTWNGLDRRGVPVAAGMYLARLAAGGEALATIKLAVVQ